MKTKTMLLIALLLTSAYIAYLKIAGLSTFDYAHLFESIRPLIPHALAVVAAFAFELTAYLKGNSAMIIIAILVCLLAAVTYTPISLFMLFPAAILIIADVSAVILARKETK